MSLLTRTATDARESYTRVEDARRREALKSALYDRLPPARIATLLESDRMLARREVEGVLRTLSRSGQTRMTAGSQRERLVDETLAEVLGLGAIERYLAEDAVTEIMVNGYRQIFVEREGKVVPTPDCYVSEEQLRSVIDRIISPLGRRIDEANPIVNGRLSAGHRVNAIIPPLVLNGPCLTIRKFAERVWSLDELIGEGSLDATVVQLLRWAVQARKNIAVTGGTGSGKTTLLNSLSHELSIDERIVTIEDSAELKFDDHPHVVRCEARPANLEGKGAVSIRDLVINALRMRPDRIIVGEVRGAEALEMLQAMNTGHDGSMTTLHANSPSEAMSRLVTMVGYGVDLPLRQVETQIAAALDLIVHLERQSDGSRKLVSLVELQSVDSYGDADSAIERVRPFQLVECLRFEHGGLDGAGRVHGTWRWYEVPQLVGSLVRHGLAEKKEVETWTHSLGR